MPIDEEREEFDLQEEGSPDPVTVKDSVDQEPEDRVPLRNRLAEERRKREALEAKLASIEAKLDEQASGSSIELRNSGYAQDSIPQNIPVREPQRSEMELTPEQVQELQNDPVKQTQYLAEFAARRATQAALTNVTRDQLDRQTMEEFPDLKNRNSLVFKETGKILNEWGTQYIQSNGTFGRDTRIDPTAYRDAAEIAMSRLIRSGKITPGDSEEARMQRIQAGAGVRGRNRSEQPEATDELNPAHDYLYESLGKAAGLTRKQYAEKLANRNKRKRR